MADPAPLALAYRGGRCSDRNEVALDVIGQFVGEFGDHRRRCRDGDFGASGLIHKQFRTRAIGERLGRADCLKQSVILRPREGFNASTQMRFRRIGQGRLGGLLLAAGLTFVL